MQVERNFRRAQLRLGGTTDGCTNGGQAKLFDFEMAAVVPRLVRLADFDRVVAELRFLRNFPGGLGNAVCVERRRHFELVAAAEVRDADRSLPR